MRGREVFKLSMKRRALFNDCCIVGIKKKLKVQCSIKISEKVSDHDSMFKIRRRGSGMM